MKKRITPRLTPTGRPSNSVVARLGALFESGWSGTLAQAVLKLRSTEATVRQAIADLKNEKYALGRPLNIKQSMNGIFSL